MGKIKLVVLLSILVSLIFVLSSFLWPSLWVEYAYECEPYTISVKVEDAGGTHYITHSGTTCGWNAYYRTGYSGGGSGSGGGEPPGGSGLPPEGVGQVTNSYDTDANGRVDCWRGAMVRVDGFLAYNYGEVRTREDGTQYVHWAYDFSIPKTNIRGLEIYSATNGTVIGKAQTVNNDGGWWIAVQADDGSIWTYCHMLNEPPLERYDRVSAGITILGQIDNTGASKGDHIHLSVVTGGAVQLPIDYLAWIQNGCQ